MHGQTCKIGIYNKAEEKTIILTQDFRRVGSELRAPEYQSNSSECPPRVSMQAWQQKTSMALLSSNTTDWGCSQRFPLKHPTTVVARWGSTD